MFKIIEKKQLSADVFYMKVTAPDIARNRKAGQFVLVQLDTDYGERVPLTIADADGKAGWIALVFQAVGATTLKLSRSLVIPPSICWTVFDAKDTKFSSFFLVFASDPASWESSERSFMYAAPATIWEVDIFYPLSFALF